MQPASETENNVIGRFPALSVQNRTERPIVGLRANKLLSPFKGEEAKAGELE